jgi:hypothetical protein
LLVNYMVKYQISKFSDIVYILLELLYTTLVE